MAIMTMKSLTSQTFLVYAIFEILRNKGCEKETALSALSALKRFFAL